MNIFAIVLIICTVYFCNSGVDATICKPLSGFKIDCDECICSVSGREYTCYTRECPADVSRRQFKSREDSLDLRSSNDIPYINDEIPNSREPEDNEFDDIDFDEDKRYKFENVDSNEDASIFDTGLPDEYRYRRSLKPLALDIPHKDKKH